MLFSTVLPAREADLGSALRALEEQAQLLGNLNETDPVQLLRDYQNWAAQASSQLRYVFDLDQVESLVATNRHNFLLSINGGHPSLLHNTISAEKEDRARAFKQVLEGLRGMKRSCDSLPKFPIVPDTNVFLHQEVFFNELDWYALSNVGDHVRVMVAMTVVRELDKGKRAQAGKKVSDTNDQPVRSRARQSSKRIREMFPYADEVEKLDNHTTMELLVDPVGHRHLDDPDSEIIDRAMALKAVSGREVYVATADGNMGFMAKVGGLKVINLSD